MKRIGFTIILVGILMTVFAGFNYVTKEKVVDIGELEITADKNHVFDWSPIAGIVVIIVGGALYLYGGKKP